MIKISEITPKPMRSIRAQLTFLMVALLVCCCVVLTWLVYRSTSELLELAAANAINKGALSIVLDVGAIERSILFDALGILFFVIIAGSCAAYLLAGHYTKPVQQLSAHMKEIGPDTLSDSIEIEGGGEEVQELVKSFNQMTDQLDEAFAMQSRFSVSAAHELRTPIAVLRTKLDVFKKKKRKQNEYDELVDTMETYIDRLSAIIANLLELTETSELGEVEDVSLDAVITTVVDDLEPVAQNNMVNVQVNTQIDAHSDTPSEAQNLTVKGNANLLYRAIYNLVENAIRYNHKEGSVNIAMETEGQECLVTIADTGVGIAPEQRELVFEPFYRVNKSRSREFGGAGIGLSLVKTILKRHGASITVSENTPQGSVFTIRIPLVDAIDSE
ncbi:histidine kinase [Lancefieldella parvula DSM 20469]|uniref:histidine kinase n=1 Tax=Lancefieldella parvula (strain ATCC 33793 / DSM 20469 / CCUG 32760 / JCM 10300 / KCTC 3663 / VPI 0546 / 1246) TaxID=521095 RepID=C8W8T9_LANP1|nr:HAMP domain-containing sensor histidine kinase [Lancefieldella parvula]ACV50527.1 histidine kinase [Lancefieldella parvula DSM 20469]